MDMYDNLGNKNKEKKKLLEDALEKFRGVAEVHPDSDIIISEKKSKEDIEKEIKE